MDDGRKKDRKCCCVERICPKHRRMKLAVALFKAAVAFGALLVVLYLAYLRWN